MKNAIKKFFTSQLFLSIVFIALIIALSFPLLRNIQKRKQINEEINSIKNNIVSLEKNNEEIKKTLEYLKSNDFVEEQAKLSFGLKKKGEKIIVVKGLQKNKISDENIENQQKTGLNKLVFNAKTWFNYFFS